MIFGFFSYNLLAFKVGCTCIEEILVQLFFIACIFGSPNSKKYFPA